MVAELPKKTLKHRYLGFVITRFKSAHDFSHFPLSNYPYKLKYIPKNRGFFYKREMSLIGSD